jgi:predicted DNA-binding protein
VARPKAEEQLEQPVRVALYIEDEQRKKLRALARSTGRPWAAYVREAIDNLLAKNSGKSRKR